jgi:uncharacterized protein (TIGR02145 family)
VISFFLIHSCQKEKPVPVISTNTVENILSTYAESGGEVHDRGGSPILSRGICWNDSENPTIGDNKVIDNNITLENSGLGSFTVEIKNLLPNTLYFIRAFATSSFGTGYGDQVTFTTNQISTPYIKTVEISSLTDESAISGGDIISDNGSSINQRGVCWGTIKIPDIANFKTEQGSGGGMYSSPLTGLSANTTYYYRAYATNAIGTSYGNTLSFRTKFGGKILYTPGLLYGLLEDIDGNEYKTITIGTKTWLAENLRTTRYSDGSIIPLVTDGKAWSDLQTPGYCWYDNNPGIYKNTFGALYNWRAAKDNKLCPVGWHVTTALEWQELQNYVGSTTSGITLREAGVTHWNSSSPDVINAYGFTALPGGVRRHSFTSNPSESPYSPFEEIGISSNWWSKYGSDDVSWRISNESRSLSHSFLSYMQDGYSVRCVKD